VLSGRFFSLANPAAAIYIPHSDYFPIFEPDVKALRCACYLRDTDGDGFLYGNDIYSYA